MSDYHILTQDTSKKTATVVFRIQIPDVANSAGVLYRTALTDYLKYSRRVDTIASISPLTDAAELLQVQSGEIYEVRESVRFSSLSLTPIQKRNEIDARYNELITEARDRLQIILAWWGLKRTVS